MSHDITTVYEIYTTTIYVILPYNFIIKSNPVIYICVSFSLRTTVTLVLQEYSTLNSVLFTVFTLDKWDYTIGGDTLMASTFS